MRIVLASIFLLLSFNIFAANTKNVVTADFEAEYLSLYGDFTGLKKATCYPVQGELFTCLAEIKIIDMADPENGLGGSEESCQERYTYNTITSDLTEVCSSCQYARSYDFYDKSCQ